MKFPLNELKNNKIKEIKMKLNINNKICKIKIGKKQSIGFFCKIPFLDINNMLPVFITNNHIINKDLLYKDNTNLEIIVEDEHNVRNFNLNNRMKYTNEDYDITIIEIKKEDKISNYLELDDNIINDLINNNKNYIDKTVYLIEYKKGELSVSNGILDKINEKQNYEFNHKCNTDGESSGSPILNLDNKLIGICKKGYNNKYNKGTFLNYPIKEYIKLYNKNKQKELSDLMNMNNNMNMMNMLNPMNMMNMLNPMNMNKLNPMKMMNMSYQVSQNLTLIRLKKEFSLCSQDRELKGLGCQFIMENNNYFIWRVTLKGPKETPYEGGIFTLRITFPFDYPKKGPEFRFLNLAYILFADYIEQKNLGHIDFHFLNEWRSTGKVIEKPGYGVKQALIDIFCLFFTQEAGCYDTRMEEEYLYKRKDFDAKAKMFTQKYAQQAIFY